IPFLFEGERKIMRAWEGVKEMEQNVDTLLIINNENLRKIYPDLDFLNAFGKADDILTTAAKSIVDIITIDGYINLDFADVNTTLKNGGKAIMSAGIGSGENRVSKAIQDALTSPLLNDNEIYNAKKILFNLYFGNIKMKEMDEVSTFMAKFERNFDCKWGVTIDERLGDDVKIIILASGFKEDSQGTPLGRQTGSETDSVSGTPGDPKSSIIEMYGAEAAKQMEKNRVRASYVILKAEQMDDDSLLETLDKSPTYNRDPQFTTRLTINSQTTPAGEEAQPAPKTDDNDGIDKIIF
ncbi:MAG: cell division protein FtsZ, partial [Coprobacter sp.]|nr:cell division protein FtsZ [Coprobacter sp.]